ncbi:MAG TPA: 16S rRNA (cytidine(1402)-2'-O)-methyltransferase [Candidatus Limnocylindrales bacterium]|nr:16S rRNA (cytidine(1402)-2'-O)-methyltransferase [Candidatus Limnocylindrales bacterium]
MAGRLYVVATPIGNMGDLSPRAAEVLAKVDMVAAEDTRVTGKLLARIDAKNRMVSYREQTERRLSEDLVERMLAGESVALVSDAGTPTISDPGYRLVHAAAEAGLEVVSIPGPSAAIALLSVSGLPTDRFRFEGFPPSRVSARRRLLESLRGAGTTVIFYESPHRVVEFLGEVADALGDPPVAAGRELTKMYEEVVRGKASEVAARFSTREPRGEFVLAVRVEADDDELAGEALDREVAALADSGVPAREIARRLKPRGAHRRDVYDALRRLGAADADDEEQVVEEEADDDGPAT